MSTVRFRLLCSRKIPASCLLVCAVPARGVFACMLNTLLWTCKAFHALLGHCYLYLLTLLLIFGTTLTGPVICAGTTPMMWSLNFLNRAPCRAFVMKSPIISRVGHHLIVSSPLLTLSVTFCYNRTSRVQLKAGGIDKGKSSSET